MRWQNTCLKSITKINLEGNHHTFSTIYSTIITNVNNFFPNWDSKITFCGIVNILLGYNSCWYDIGYCYNVARRIAKQNRKAVKSTKSQNKIAGKGSTANAALFYLCKIKNHY